MKCGQPADGARLLAGIRAASRSPTTRSGRQSPPAMPTTRRRTEGRASSGIPPLRCLTHSRHIATILKFSLFCLGSTFFFLFKIQNRYLNLFKQRSFPPFSPKNCSTWVLPSLPKSYFPHTCHISEAKPSTFVSGTAREAGPAGGGLRPLPGVPRGAAGRVHAGHVQDVPAHRHPRHASVQEVQRQVCPPQAVWAPVGDGRPPWELCIWERVCVLVCWFGEDCVAVESCCPGKSTPPSEGD